MDVVVYITSSASKPLQYQASIEDLIEFLVEKTMRLHLFPYDLGIVVEMLLGGHGTNQMYQMHDQSERV